MYPYCMPSYTYFWLQAAVNHTALYRIGLEKITKDRSFSARLVLRTIPSRSR